MENSNDKNFYKGTSKDWFNFVVMSMIGIFMFFIPITLGGNSTIPLDHIVSAIRNNFPVFSKYYALVVIILGALYPFCEPLPLNKKQYLEGASLTILRQPNC